MAYAVFHKRFEFDFRPQKAVCRVFDPSRTPQLVSDVVLQAALTAKAAKEVVPPKRKRKNQN